MRLLIAAFAGLFATSSLAAPPADRGHAKARELYQRSIEIPTVVGRGQGVAMADYLAGEFRAAGFATGDIHVLPYTSAPRDDTAALIVRRPASGRPGR